MRKAVLQEHKNSDENKIYIDLSRGKSFLATEVVKKAVTSYLSKLKDDLEQAEKEQYSFKILATEQKLTATVNVDDQAIKLKGFADRIDLRKGLVTLLDYKTGYVDDKGLKCDDLSDIFTSTEHKQLLQLLMYAYLFDRGQNTGRRGQDTGVSDQGSEDCNLKPVICNLETVNCQLSTVNYSCGIISFQRLYKKEQHELYPTFQGTGDKGQGTEITPEILDLFESHLINLLRDIINPEQPFVQTDDENHCRYCDYTAICKKSNTQDE